MIRIRQIRRRRGSSPISVLPNFRSLPPGHSSTNIDACDPFRSEMMNSLGEGTKTSPCRTGVRWISRHLSPPPTIPRSVSATNKRGKYERRLLVAAAGRCGGRFRRLMESGRLALTLLAVRLAVTSERLCSVVPPQSVVVFFPRSFVLFSPRSSASLIRGPARHATKRTVTRSYWRGARPAATHEAFAVGSSYARGRRLW